MILPGKLAIGRWSSGDGSDRIYIELVDVASGLRFVHAEVGLEDFAMALTGRGNVPATMDVRGLERLGMIREQKQMRLCPLPLPYTPTGGDGLMAMARQTVEPYEVDGWTADDPMQLLNSNRLAPGERDVYLVGFTRWVPPGVVVPEEGGS